MLILLSPLTKVSVLISWTCQHHKRNKKQFYKNQNRSTGVCSVNLFSGVVSSTSPSMSSDTDLETLIFIKSTSVSSSDVVSYSFWNFPGSIPSNASDSPIIVALSTISFMFSLIGSVINPVKSPITSEHSFLQQEFVSGLMPFMALCITMMPSSIILPDFHDVFFIGVSLNSIDNHFHRIVCNEP